MIALWIGCLWQNAASAQTGSAYGVAHRFAEKGLKFPKRTYGGVWNCKLIWGHLTDSRVLSIIKNPAYAGVYRVRPFSVREADLAGRSDPPTRASDASRLVARRNPEPSTGTAQLEASRGPVFKLGMEANILSRIVSAIGKKAGVVVNKADGTFASAHDLRRAFGTR